ncbi:MULTISPECIES: UDP-N-acetylmuramoyl-L-alanine--D-glutamate ligase [Arthrobacter]|uniref:UDP-N-acetylmuramoylalanine--D-glutamate ligase n=1 Tax=Arthrobacter caoxuetaonis TaxID=2886935 RepID=A0A9X1SE00_9MICC|nr:MULTISPECIES: UDP-N-acetylmuramoyl-L-alanine--D-glutamate ligase [Arthrobacter]MCC3283702.1 UDP-N-acetylmuramoyl-L-alanine--D-glutamate ligase [Arthrobacter caoxuetaonis]MCC3299156.1 UDP-N-acetylmuramoyl-L-alanine--D-glutamate ligase [Arthrobacter caoxuetaonis]MCC9193140.1 UDP-N-acetylmuramoyl-L-alanine--D-glutamate ligase [Arthrobacter sp. zg-Y916]USQ58514.1 UDP-N-acetylmuramoyl-L-alanine--D-glutamate ligase [Arthrobacter caoxuetaonis]
MSDAYTDTPRLASLTTWDSDWRGLRVVVTGIGLSGFSAADTLIELGARVVVVDGQDSEETRAKADTLRIVGAASVLLGADAAAALPLVDGEQPELVVTSPGFSPEHPVLAQAAAAGIPVWGDVELAWRVRIREGRPTAPWLAITGTNGKTTTVSMTESMLLAAGLRAVAAGNVGTPILDAIRDPQGWDVIAVELSSFQLHWTHTMSPLASVCLNIAEDHVDWHGGYDGYRAAKAKVYENTQVACIYNAEQAETEHMVEEADVVEGCRAIGFTTGMPAISMLGIVEGLLVDRAFIEQRRDSAAELASLDDLGDRAPRHLAANALAAAALVRAFGVEPVAVRDGLRNYAPGGHRIEPVAKLNDILWVNDSKATNPHAAAASLAAFPSVVWIAGGLSKGVTYDDLVQAHAPRLRAVVLIGTDSSELRGALTRHAPDVPVIEAAAADTGGEIPSTGEAVMVQAVTAAAAAAEPGDTVLMAPASASMDQFRSYAHRGEAFIEAVRGYVEGQAQTTEEP